MLLAQWHGLAIIRPSGHKHTLKGMLMKIFKYPLEVTDTQIIEMPQDATILCVQVQHTVPCIWAAVDENAKRFSRTIYTVGTGHSMNKIPLDAQYVGTYQIENGMLVFHVWAD